MEDCRLKEWAEQLLSACYVRKDRATAICLSYLYARLLIFVCSQDKKGVIQWARKKNDIQLGWLDRLPAVRS